MNSIIDFLPDLITDSGSVLAGVLLVVYAAITSLRKRRDLNLTELLKRIENLEGKVDVLEVEKQNAHDRAASYQASLLVSQSDNFLLRSALASNGLPDPTVRETPSA